MKLLSQNPTSLSTPSFSIIIFFFLLFIYFSENGDGATQNKNESVPAVFVFGDSIADPGNNNNIKTIIKCNFPPYGRDFKGKIATGRFSNGVIPSDLIAQEFGIKELLPAYLDPNLKPQDLVTGVSFASGGAGYDPLTSKVAELYGVGARRIGVLSLPPIGCVPVQRTLNGGIARGCSDFANQAAQIYNSKLQSVVDSLSKEFPDSRFVYFDIYNPLNSLIQNPPQYGFEVADKGCCGTGNLEVSILCNRLEDAATCPDASKYIFWDSYHPTEKAYKILTPKILNQNKDKLF
ncbi:GDSL esterase/lipase EXL3 [Citrus sinensis]|uniref:SGNH hydrolase-type esterase domain-containing protein n=1 Tax=Citrus clementina TaxID=85681 RepID=V4RV82_CITCL|nr:hypothetical protein CICLE_v10025900mg [Citrus x clementina]KAH9662602.1 GDSL esterase/lipase EXL3 [Citrus sinensis]